MKQNSVIPGPCSLTIEMDVKSICPTLTVKSASKYIGISVKTVYRLIKSGDLNPKKVGGQYKFLKSEIDHWLRGE